MYRPEVLSIAISPLIAIIPSITKDVTVDHGPSKICKPKI